MKRKNKAKADWTPKRSIFHANFLSFDCDIRFKIQKLTVGIKQSLGKSAFLQGVEKKTEQQNTFNSLKIKALEGNKNLSGKMTDSFIIRVGFLIFGCFKKVKYPNL